MAATSGFSWEERFLQTNTSPSSLLLLLSLSPHGLLVIKTTGDGEGEGGEGREIRNIITTCPLVLQKVIRREMRENWALC